MRKPLGIMISFVLVVAISILLVANLQAKDKKRGWLGVAIITVDKDLVADENLKVELGAYVSDVDEDSPAEKAGIREGDVILEFNGKRVEDADELVRLVRRTSRGDKVKIKIDREGKSKNLKAEMEERRSRIFSFSGPGHFATIYIGDEGAWLGVDMYDLTDQLREYFGVKEYEGVLVVNVVEDSPAEKAGLKGGDIVTKFGGRDIEDSDDLRKAVGKYEPDDEVEVEYVRRGKRSKLNVKLAEREDDSFDYNWFNIGGSGIRIIGGDDEAIILRDDMKNLSKDMMELQLKIDGSLKEEMLRLKDEIGKSIGRYKKTRLHVI